MGMSILLTQRAFNLEHAPMARSQMVDVDRMLRRPSATPPMAPRRSTVGTLNMGTWAGTGEALAWDIASDVPSTSPSHGSNSGAHRESYSTHTYAFKRSCT